MYADEVQSKLREIRLAGLLSLVSSILPAAAFCRLLSNNFTLRISNLTERLSTIVPDQGVGVSMSTRDELNQLSEAFDQMSVRLKKSRQQLDYRSRCVDLPQYPFFPNCNDVTVKGAPG